MVRKKGISNCFFICIYCAVIISTLEPSLISPSFADKTKNAPLKGRISGRVPPQLEVRLKTGNCRDVASSDFFIPLAQNEHSLLFLDARLVADVKKSHEYNIGFIARTRLGPDLFCGGGPYFDRRKTKLNHYYNQLAFNAHLLTSTWQVQANAYLPETRVKKRTKGKARSQGLPNQGYASSRIGKKYIILERALRGCDFEVSYAHLEFQNLRGRLKGYYFHAKDFASVRGFGAALEYKANDVVKFEAEYLRDNVRKNIFYAGISFTIPLSSTQKSKATSKVDRLFSTKVSRDIDLFTYEKKESLLEIYPVQKQNLPAASATQPAAPAPALQQNLPAASATQPAAPAPALPLGKSNSDSTQDDDPYIYDDDPYIDDSIDEYDSIDEIAAGKRKCGPITSTPLQSALPMRKSRSDSALMSHSSTDGTSGINLDEELKMLDNLELPPSSIPSSPINDLTDKTSNDEPDAKSAEELEHYCKRFPREYYEAVHYESTESLSFYDEFEAHTNAPEITPQKQSESPTK